MKTTLKTVTDKFWVTEMFKKTAAKIGATIFVEPIYQRAGYLIFKNQKRIFFRSERFNINNAGSIESVKDKNYCHFFLNKFGYNIPEGQAFFSDAINEQVNVKKTIEDGFHYAHKIGWPVVLKPNNGSKGQLVNRVDNQSDYYLIAQEIFKNAPVLIVEKFYDGCDYRVIVFRNKVFAAYKRSPFAITGNGSQTIFELLNEAKELLEKSGNGTLDINDSRIRKALQDSALTYDRVLQKGRRITLLTNANVSNGGKMEDITSKIHPVFKTIMVKVAKDLNLILCGIDIISADLTKCDSKYVIIEVNSAPALKHYASLGLVQLHRTENLYLKIFRYLESK